MSVITENGVVRVVERRLPPGKMIVTVNGITSLVDRSEFLARNGPVQGLCEVCALVDRDTSVKTVDWCRQCSAWICKTCQPDTVRRAAAMALKAKSQVAGVVKRCCGGQR